MTANRGIKLPCVFQIFDALAQRLLRRLSHRPYRSESPSTKSILPMEAITSASMVPSTIRFVA